MTKEIKKMKANSSPVAIIPLGDRVLIKEDTKSKENKTASGIIIPITVSDDKGSKRGEVISVGVGKYEDGKLIAMTVKTGDEVLFQWGDKVILDGEEYYLVRETEILAIIK